MDRRMEPEARISLRDGGSVMVYRLTPELARARGEELAALHNLVPFQDWSSDEIAADELHGTRFVGKWQLSRVAAVEEELIAINLAYERPKSVDPYGEDCIYMHRLAVRADFRNRGIGSLFHAHVIDCAFGHRPTAFATADPDIFGQTQVTVENATVLRGYVEGTGFTPVGFKYYPEKVDVVLRLHRDTFYNSLHWQLLLAARELLSNQTQ